MSSFFNKVIDFFQKIPSLIVKARWYFVVIFLALTIFGCCMIPRINVAYDLTGYLPEDCDATDAMQVLKKEFDDKGMAYVCVKDVTKEEAFLIQQEIADIDGVAMVTYVELTNYKNGNALYTVSLDDYDSTMGAFTAVENIIDTLSDEKAYLTGQSAYSYYTKLETEESIYKLGIAIAIIILLVMLFTSKTYFEMVVLIIVFAVSMGINMGTNFIFPQISYISNLVSLVLQLALSLDYSIILLRRFMEEKDKGLDAKEAVADALKKGIPEILSSSLTTIAGLVSLMLMVLEIGAEIGLSLAKGIFISMLTVIFFMPALLVLCDKPLEKTKHKKFVPRVVRPSRAILKARLVIVPVFCILIILAGVGQSYNKYSFNYNGGSKIVAGQTAIKEAGFGTLNTMVVIVPKGDAEKERELASYINSFDIIDDNETTSLSSINIYSFIDENSDKKLYLTDEVCADDVKSLVIPFLGGDEELEESVPQLVDNVFNLYYKNRNVDNGKKIRIIDLLDYVASSNSIMMVLEGFSNKKMDIAGYLTQLQYAKNNLESDNYIRITFTIDAGVEDDDTFAFVKEIKAHLSDYYDEHYVMGESVVCYEMSEYFTQDNTRVTLFTILFVLVILLFTFKNIALPIILILAIQGGIFINFSIPFILHNSTSFIGYLIISAIQMGATIDYAIVLTNRYQTIKGQYGNKLDAMAEAENAVFSTVITSGVILTLTGFVMGALSTGVVSQMGYLLGIGTLTSMTIVLFVLPSLLIVSDPIVEKLHFRNLFKRKSK